VPDPVAAVCQVGDLITDALMASERLAGFRIVNEASAAIAAEEYEGELIRLFLVSHRFENEHMMGQTRHIAVFEAEAVTRDELPGSLSRSAMNAIAAIAGAIAQDRTLGGNIEDIQEVDVGATGAAGKDVAGASIQFQTVFYTSRSDWFTLVT